ncbi:MAG: hypothetical protein COC09_03205 [Gammaproteobacteria bacterium]|nr:accessory factor UbiK family protein [Gammaproteobacteria bacterium]PCH64257.1 MAG: hypothetical protein COC09_03205 [Gammaproteobacteria bacterium]
MIDPKLFDELSKKLASAVPSGIREVQADLEQQFLAMLQSRLGKLDLVTREQFDVQRGVLERTRSKVDALEEQLAELETLQ